MNTENLSTLKIHKLTQAQYDRALANGDIKENELYLTPDEEIDLTPYATVEQMNEKADAEHEHDDRYYTETEVDIKFNDTKEYIDVRVPAWTSADESKSLRIVNGVPTWSAGVIASTTSISENSSSSYPENTLYVVYE